MNATDQQTNTNQDQSHHDPKGAQLRQTLEHLTLQKMIDQVQDQDLNHKELCDILHTCYQLKKADAAEEKTRSTERIAMHRLNKTNQPTNPPHPNTNTTNPNANTNTISNTNANSNTNTISNTNAGANTTNPAHDRLPLRDPASPQTQPGDLDDPNTNPTEKSHRLFCRNLAKAAMDIWGVDISDVCKTDKPQYEETDTSETEDLYDIPPQYRQGATPIQGSEQKYGQPKYTRKEWRRIMFRAIRENYGIYDNPQPTHKTQTPARSASEDRQKTHQPQTHQPQTNQPPPIQNHPRDKKNQPEAPARTVPTPNNTSPKRTLGPPTRRPTATDPAHAANQERAPPPNPRTNTKTSPKRQRGPPAPHALANTANDQRSVPRPACRLAALPNEQTVHSPPAKPKTTNHANDRLPLRVTHPISPTPSSSSTCRRFDVLTFLCPPRPKLSQKN